MDIEQVYLDLLSYYDKLPGPKMNRTAWFYRDGGVKDVIEKAHPKYLYENLTDQLNHQTELTEQVAEIIKDCFDAGDFDNCTTDEMQTLRNWLRENE